MSRFLRLVVARRWRSAILKYRALWSARCSIQVSLHREDQIVSGGHIRHMQSFWRQGTAKHTRCPSNRFVISFSTRRDERSGSYLSSASFQDGLPLWFQACWNSLLSRILSHCSEQRVQTYRMSKGKV